MYSQPSSLLPCASPDRISAALFHPQAGQFQPFFNFPSDKSVHWEELLISSIYILHPAFSRLCEVIDRFYVQEQSTSTRWSLASLANSEGDTKLLGLTSLIGTAAVAGGGFLGQSLLHTKLTSSCTYLLALQQHYARLHNSSNSNSLLSLYHHWLSSVVESRTQGRQQGRNSLCAVALIMHLELPLCKGNDQVFGIDIAPISSSRDCRNWI